MPRRTAVRGCGQACARGNWRPGAPGWPGRTPGMRAGCLPAGSWYGHGSGESGPCRRDAQGGGHVSVGEVRPGDHEQDLRVALGEGRESPGQVAVGGGGVDAAEGVVGCRFPRVRTGSAPVRAQARSMRISDLVCLPIRFAAMPYSQGRASRADRSMIAASSGRRHGGCLLRASAGGLACAAPGVGEYRHLVITRSRRSGSRAGASLESCSSAVSPGIRREAVRLLYHGPCPPCPTRRAGCRRPRRHRPPGNMAAPPRSPPGRC